MLCLTGNKWTFCSPSVMCMTKDLKQLNFNLIMLLRHFRSLQLSAMKL